MRSRREGGGGRAGARVAIRSVCDCGEPPSRSSCLRGRREEVETVERRVGQIGGAEGVVLVLGWWTWVVGGRAVVVILGGSGGLLHC